MADDIRISVDLFTHPKFKKLCRRLGAEGGLCLMKLWGWAARNRQAGELTGMEVEDVELAADWPGDDGRFVEELLSLKLLDQDGGSYFIHDWQGWQGWVCQEQSRGDKARFSRLAQVAPLEHSRLQQQGVNAISRADYDKLTKPVLAVASETPLETPAIASAAPAPSPSPSPAPAPAHHRQEGDDERFDFSREDLDLIKQWEQKWCKLEAEDYKDKEIGNKIKRMLWAVTQSWFTIETTPLARLRGMDKDFEGMREDVAASSLETEYLDVLQGEV